MNKYPLFLQDDPALDGVSCIRMILKYYGIEEDSLMIKKKCRTDRHGTTMKGLSEALADYTIEAAVAQMDDTALADVPLPCILNVKSAQRDHYVVLYEKTPQYYIVGDPQMGERHLSDDELKAMYGGKLIQITHLGRYYDYGNKTLFDDLKRWRKHYQRLWPLKGSALICALSLMTMAGIIVWMIDYWHVSFPWWLTYLAVLLFLMALTLLTVSQNILDKWKIKIHRALSEHFVLKSVRTCIDGDELVYAKGEWGVLNEIGDMHALTDYGEHYFVFWHHDLFLMVILGLFLLFLHTPLALFSLASLFILVVLICWRSTSLRQFSSSALRRVHTLKEKLYEYIHLRSLRFLDGSSYWYERYEKLFKEGEGQKQEVRRRLKTAVCLWLSGMLSVNLIGGFYFCCRHFLTRGRLIAYFLILLCLFYRLLPLFALLTKRSLALTLFEEFKELNSTEYSGHNPFDEPITAITISNLTYHYGSYEPVIHHFDAVFDHSVFIDGPSGGGKTTLLKLLAGMDPVYHGHILINEKELSGIDRYDLASHIVYVGEPLFAYGTIADNLMGDMEAALSILNMFSATYLQEHLDLTILADGSPLTHRDQVILMLTRSLIVRRDVYLLDGVFDHLSDRDAADILDVLLKGYPDVIFLVVASHHDDRLDSCVIQAQDLHGG